VKQLPFLSVIAVAHIHNFAQAILRNLDLREGLAGAEIADVRKMHRLRIGAYFKMTETGQEGCISCAHLLGAEACLSLIKSRNFGCLPILA